MDAAENVAAGRRGFTVDRDRPHAGAGAVAGLVGAFAAWRLSAIAVARPL